MSTVQVIVRGPRRSGKTTIAAVLMEALTKAGVPDSDIRFDAEYRAELEAMQETQSYIQRSNGQPLKDPPVAGRRDIRITTEDEEDAFRYPHCDPRILHAPSKCKYCDKCPEAQALRKAWNIAFTGQVPAEGQIQCPAEQARPLEVIERWGGNVPDTRP